MKFEWLERVETGNTILSTEPHGSWWFPSWENEFVDWQFKSVRLLRIENFGKNDKLIIKIHENFTIFKK